MSTQTQEAPKTEAPTNTTELGNLKFLQSYTPRQFKEMVGADSIDIIKNPNTGKLFFNVVGTDVSGKVSKDLGANDEVVVTKCDDPTNPEEEPFWMIHKKGADNVVRTL